MVDIVIRAIQSAVAIAVGIGTASWVGEGNLGKLVAIPIGAACAILIEFLLRVAPRRSPWAREILDPRSVFEGVWIQNVKRVVADGSIVEANRFAVFTVRYNGDFSVEGRAYDEFGEEFSRWHSEGPASFSRDARTMVYLWKGDIIGNNAEPTGDRRGFAQLMLSPSGNGGIGLVDHLSLPVKLHFDMQRVTPDMLSDTPIQEPTALVDPVARDAFARFYAKRLRLGETPGLAAVSA